MTSKDEFLMMIKTNEGIIYKVTSLYGADNEDKKDLYQEIIYQMWKSFSSFRKEAKSSTWMYRVALNTALMHQRKKNKRQDDLPLNEIVLNRYEEQDPLKEQQIKELYERIATLNGVEKGLVLLYLEGKSYEEIGNISGMSTSNVGTRLNRIKQKMKTQSKDI